MKRVLISGISGQDGWYLTQLLHKEGYDLFGLHRENSVIHPDVKNKVTLIDGDLTDHTSLQRAFEIAQPDFVYNLAGFSHIGRSFHQPEIVIDVNTLGVVRILEIIKNKFPTTKFLQASTYEVFAGNEQMPISETSPIKPVSPYSISKAAADGYVKLYRKNYGLFVCSAYLGNHESPFRQEHFVTRKISKYFGALKRGQKLPPLSLGYLDARRDFGYAPDYCKAMKLILEQDVADDYIVSSGIQSSVRRICDIALKHVGITGMWFGGDQHEYFRKIETDYHPQHTLTLNCEDLVPIIQIDPSLYRPTDVPVLTANVTKINKLGWHSETKIATIIKEMIDHDSKI